MTKKSQPRHWISIRLLGLVGLLGIGCATAIPTAALPDPSPTLLLETEENVPSQTAVPETTPTQQQAGNQIAPCQPDATLSGENPYPAPTGRYQVSVTAFQLVDLTRPEILTGTQSNFRTITIYVWYPAEPTGDTTLCSYTSTFAREHSRFDGYVEFYGIDPDAAFQHISEFSLYAIPDAAISSVHDTYEVVIFSNWEAGLPVNQSSQLQQLASSVFSSSM